MKEIRLLPVVIAAALALLLLKGVGIVTQGGYVLVGTSVVSAAGGGGEGEVVERERSLPAAPTLKDSTPTLDDAAPTIPLRGATEEGAHGDAPESDGPETTSDDASEAGEHAVSAEGADGCIAGIDPPAVCGEVPAAGASGEAGHAPAAGSGLAEECPEVADVNEHGDALPITRDAAGNIVPLEPADGPTSEAAILGRLAERRSELDLRATELDMRAALVEAAEKRIAERTAALEALEARINSMVDEKRSIEEREFAAIVSMYELMKPKDAAAIFDQLETDILLRVARAMSPRKMAPILARMNPAKAKDLTARMAVEEGEPTAELVAGDLGALPQIVGQ